MVRTALTVIACVAVLALPVEFGWVLRSQQHQTDRAARATTALCLLKHDLQNRVAGGENFLKHHPQGIPGIPAATIRQSLDGQRRTVNALSILKCPQSGRHDKK